MQFFLLIHRIISLTNHIVDSQFIMVGRNFDDSEAEPFGVWLFFCVVKGILDIDKPFSGNRSRQAFQNETEFITADTGQDIFFSDEFFYGMYKMADIPVALQVTISVIDVF